MMKMRGGSIHFEMGSVKKWEIYFDSGQTFLYKDDVVLKRKLLFTTYSYHSTNGYLIKLVLKTMNRRIIIYFFVEPELQLS